MNPTNNEPTAPTDTTKPFRRPCGCVWYDRHLKLVDCDDGFIGLYPQAIAPGDEIPLTEAELRKVIQGIQTEQYHAAEFRKLALTFQRIAQ